MEFRNERWHATSRYASGKIKPYAVYKLELLQAEEANKSLVTKENLEIARKKVREALDRNEEQSARLRNGRDQVRDWTESVVLAPPPPVENEDMAVMAVTSRAMQLANDKLDELLVARETERQLAQYDAYGEDTFEDKAVLKFDLKQAGYSKAFTFVALKVTKDDAEPFWHLSDGTHLTWDQLKRLLVKANPAPVLVELVAKQIEPESAK